MPVKNDIKSPRIEKIAYLKASSECSAAVVDASYMFHCGRTDHRRAGNYNTHCVLQWNAESGNGRKGHLAAKKTCWGSLVL